MSELSRVFVFLLLGASASALFMGNESRAILFAIWSSIALSFSNKN